MDATTDFSSQTRGSSLASKVCRLALFAGLSLNGAACFAAGPSTASVLPLNKGLYVDASQTCSDPANAGIRSYNGAGLSTSHTHACKMAVQSKAGNVYTVFQHCIDAGVGPGPVFKETLKIEVVSNSRFRLKQSKSVTTYHYCSPDQLPPGLEPPSDVN